jgi:hypothetical protein
VSARSICHCYFYYASTQQLRFITPENGCVILRTRCDLNFHSRQVLLRKPVRGHAAKIIFALMSIVRHFKSKGCDTCHAEKRRLSQVAEENQSKMNAIIPRSVGDEAGAARKTRSTFRCWISQVHTC